MRLKFLLPLLLAAPLFVQQPPARGERQQVERFRAEEATIAQIHEAMRARSLTCRALVDAYLRRIDAYDKNGPALNAIVLTNPDALKEADELDRRFAQSGPVGSLHCIPAIVKDNFETIGLQSAAGSLSLKGFVSNKDAFLVKRIKDAGLDVRVIHSPVNEIPADTDVVVSHEGLAARARKVAPTAVVLTFRNFMNNTASDQLLRSLVAGEQITADGQPS